MRDIAATAYVLCSFAWCVLCIGTCTYIVFWLDHSGWWYLLAMLLCGGRTSVNAAKIRGTWRKEMED